MPRIHRTWAREDIEAEVKEALALVEAVNPPDDLRVTVFNVAIQALMQRIIEQNPAGMALPTMAPSIRRQ